MYQIQCPMFPEFRCRGNEVLFCFAATHQSKSCSSCSMSWIPCTIPSLTSFGSALK
jgi:hypothetical protein